jgi:hypothetical protein
MLLPSTSWHCTLLGIHKNHMLLQRRLLEANADGSQLAIVDATGIMSVYALKHGQASMSHPKFQAEDVTSLAWNTDHAEVQTSMRLYMHLVTDSSRLAACRAWGS